MLFFFIGPFGGITFGRHLQFNDNDDDPGQNTFRDVLTALLPMLFFNFVLNFEYMGVLLPPLLGLWLFMGEGGHELLRADVRMQLGVAALVFALMYYFVYSASEFVDGGSQTRQSAYWRRPGDQVPGTGSTHRRNGDSRHRSQVHEEAEGEGVLHQFDLLIAVGLMFCVYVLPHYWFRIHALISRYLPETYRTRWNEWTRSIGIQPSVPSPGSVPTSRRALERLETIELEERHLLAEGSPSVTCAVCLEQMRLGDTAKRLPCKHMFHPNCVLPWLEKHNSCPTCRFELETDDFAYEEARRSRQEMERRHHAREFRERMERESLISSRREELMESSVTQLRELAREHNVNISDCLEKRDLVERLLTTMVSQ